MCGRTLPLEEFQRNKGKPFDRGAYCRPCGNSRWRVYNERRRARLREAGKDGAEGGKNTKVEVST